ncbi:MAG TPA: protease, partial [Myxococcales bacterium]|nr:protease [Myxococcales bacterium]
MFKKATLLAVICCAVSFGCGPANENDEIISNLIQAGFPADDIMVVDGLVYVGRDA